LAKGFVDELLATGRKLRSEYVKTHWFLSIEDACEKLDRWHRRCNDERPRSVIWE
jgi:putative transposase